MKKVITYGTFDLFHYGHKCLLERAKQLGDYLIVGITTEDYDINRGKLNVQKSLMQRVQDVKESGLADEIILEEYEGQKIDDIQKYKIDVFAIGSDWEGYFDYLKEYCEVVYLDRTEGISSTMIRESKQMLSLGIIGCGSMVDRFIQEVRYVSGVFIKGMYSVHPYNTEEKNEMKIYQSAEKLFEEVDAVYLLCPPNERYNYTKQALSYQCHVICETPIALHKNKAAELYELAKQQNKILLEGMKTAYFRAFSRLMLLIKGGIIGNVKSIDVTCTSMRPANYWTNDKKSEGGSMTDWGPFTILPILKILGENYTNCDFVSYREEKVGVDLFTQMRLIYPHAIANAKVGFGVKSEGSLVISGTKAYIYVPSPWWKTDYFEVRYEDFSQNKRYFYKVDGEGIRYELAEFLRLIRTNEKNLYLSQENSLAISEIMEKFLYGENTVLWI